MVAADLENWLLDAHRLPLVMGVLNVTPDSFSDGGKYARPEAAIEHALQMAADGAALIDVGGESTRPGAMPVAADEQIRRAVPAIEGIRRVSQVGISIDTTQWKVAQAALAAGANWINDISAGRDDPAMLPRAAAAKAPIILMHMQGKPLTMQNHPTYSDVAEEVRAFLLERAAVAEAAGIARTRILIDPGVGFGKTPDHSLTLLRKLAWLADAGLPLVVGASRKSFIGKILSESDPLRRGNGDAAVISWAVANHAAILRVHDVAAAGQVLRVTQALMRGTLKPAADEQRPSQ